MLISPSLLAADFTNLKKDVDLVNVSRATALHLDVMDGVFVPNISFGFSVLEPVAKICQKELDVHLMIVNPDRYISRVRDLGATFMTVHLEACQTHIHRVVQQIKEAGMKAGVAINPGTPVDWLNEVVADIDLALVMSVNPGFGGQKFITNSLNKVASLRQMIDSSHSKVIIQVDGGVNMTTGAQLAKAGADMLVAGSFVFKSESPLAVIDSLSLL
ncbi:MAG: ribulose-phosphate 3-epimerase [Muribaculum sp.]|nr:ribulose-phosphate 3-epimerase [Muribaculaceae bacterium]MCM1080967.1 ribulose-phosphate 3-epimerase [Muribaculum sp.]